MRNQSNCNQKYQTGNQITRLGKQRGIEKTNQKLNVETQKQNKLKKPTASTELHPSPTPAHYQPTAHNQLAGQTPNAGSPHCQNSLDRARLAHKQASLLVHPWHTAHSTTARAAIKESSEPPVQHPRPSMPTLSCTTSSLQPIEPHLCQPKPSRPQPIKPTPEVNIGLRSGGGSPIAHLALGNILVPSREKVQEFYFFFF